MPRGATRSWGLSKDSNDQRASAIVCEHHALDAAGGLAIQWREIEIGRQRVEEAA